VTGPLPDPGLTLDARHLRKIVTGEARWTPALLEQAGITFQLKKMKIAPPRAEAPTFIAPPSDVARGLLALSEEPRALRLWVSVLLAQPGCLELSSDFELTAEGDRLLEVLWDCNFDVPIEEETRQFLIELAKGSLD
jgi:hypothetical protein